MRPASLCIAIVCLLVPAHALPAGDCLSNCCASCGCAHHCRKVCVPKCDFKEVKEVEWVVECEDFCVPGRSCPAGCSHDECGNCATCYSPSCGHVRTRKKLVRIEVTRRVPVTKCEVVTLCDHCCRHAAISPATTEERLAASAAAATSATVVSHTAASAQPNARWYDKRLPRSESR